ncbi:type 1 fimbrial adaptor subunit FimF [Tatumella citrea]|nr:fimbrial protein [Tatumella citrea]
MKRYLQLIALTTVITGPLIISSISFAADSTITITGNVQDNTCVLSTGSQNLTVNLMSYSLKQFPEKGASSAVVPFTLDFSACGSSATAVKIGFTGTADTNNTSLLKIDSGDSTDATGLGVEILDSDQNAVPINQTQDDLNWVSLTGGQQNSVNFYARMVSTTSSVTAGTVSASATITLEFE